MNSVPLKVDLYETKRSNDPKHEAWERLVSGKYAVLSWEALGALFRRDNVTDFTLTAELVSKCCFVGKQVFQSKDPAAFEAQKPKGIDQIVRPEAKRSGLEEQILLGPFLNQEKFLTDEERVFISADLKEDFAQCQITPNLLDKCVFVSKQVFNPDITKKYACDINDGNPAVTKVAKLSTAIQNMISFRDAARKLNQDPSQQISYMYSISVY